MTRRKAAMTPVEPRVLTKLQAARYLGVSRTTLDKLVKDRVVTVIRYAGVRKDFFDRAELDRLIARSSQIENSTTPLPLSGDKYGYLRIAMGGKGPASD